MSERTARILADVLLVTHFAIVLFVIVGLVVTIIGLALRWRWVRNFWFRTAHLAAIGVVVMQAWLGVMCPLTVWENELRMRAGGEGYDDGFIAHWVARLLYYDLEPWVFTLAYTLFGAAVLATFIFGRPKMPGRRVSREQ